MKTQLNRWAVAALITLAALISSSAGLLYYIYTFYLAGPVEAGTDEAIVTPLGTYQLDEYYLTDETEFFLPYEGHEYLICELSLVNSTDQNIAYSSNNIRLVDANGQELEEDVWAISSQDGFGNGTLVPGQSHTGQIGFQVPISDETLRLNIYENASDPLPLAAFMIDQNEAPFLPFSQSLGDIGTDTDSSLDSSLLDTDSDSSDGARTVQVNESHIGENGMTYTLLSVDYSSTSKQGVQARSGYQFASCYVRVDNTSSRDQINYATFWLISDGADFVDFFSSSGGAGAGQDYRGGNIEPSQSLEGYLTFEVPESALLTLSVYNDSLYASNEVEASWTLPLS